MKLALGAVPFGLNYGINNLSGQLTIDEVKNHEIDILDTASGCGNSEQIIVKTISLKVDVNKAIDAFSTYTPEQVNFLLNRYK
jgi:hypothetical protein